MLDSKQNITVFGHAKHGKSTVCGRLIHEFNSISERDLELLEVEATQKGKDFNRYNLLFLKNQPAIWHNDKPGDTSRTAYPQRGNAELNDGKSITFIDAPGHIQWIDNIVYSAYLADQAIVTISSNSGIQEGTLEVIKILNGYSIPVLAILITKMDIVGYSRLAFDEIVNSLRDNLRAKYNIDLDNLTNHIIPISAIGGEGIRSFKEIDWFTGSNLIDLIENHGINDSFNNNGSVRFVIEGPHDIYNVPSVGTIMVGLLEFGIVKVGDELILEPATTISQSKIKMKVKNIRYAKAVNSIQITDVDLDSVGARTIISTLVSTYSVDDVKKYVSKGGILSQTSATVANEIEAYVNFFEPESIYVGKECVLHSNASFAGAVISAVLDKKDGFNDIIEKMSLNIKIKLKSPICIESDSSFKRLQRFLLRKDNSIIGCGVCTKIIS